MKILQDNISKSLLVVTLIFVSTLLYKHVHIGTLSEGRDQFLTAHTAVIVDNWIEDGILKDNLIPLMAPDSIEFESRESRSPYVSFPPGAMLPIWLVKSVFNDTDTILLIHIVGMGIHLLTSIFITLCVWVCLKDVFMDQKYSALYSTFAGISYILMPVPNYWHTVVYFGDIANMAPFAAILFVETLIRRNPERRDLKVIQSFIFAIMAFIDYFAVATSIAVFAFRLVAPIDKRHRSISSIFSTAIQIFTPVALVISLYFFHLFINGHLDILIERFLFRTNLTHAITFREFMERAIYGNIGLAFVISAFLSGFCVFGLLKKKSQAFIIPLIGFVSCLFYYILLPQHSMHEFNALKFYIPLAITLFGIFPALIQNQTSLVLANVKTDKSVAYIKSILLPSLIAFILSVFYLSNYLGKIQKFPHPNVPGKEVAQNIAQLIEKDSIAIGFGFNIIDFDPLHSYYSRKIVHDFDWLQRNGGESLFVKHKVPVYFIYKEGVPPKGFNNLSEVKKIDGWVISKYNYNLP